jgi:lipopolysaccharide exporter
MPETIDRPPDPTGGAAPPHDEPLAHRIIKSGFWVFALRVSYLVLYFARIVILARVLAPGDFGAVGMALLVMSILEAFTQTGTLPALIQKKEDIRPYLNAAWTVSILRGTILGGIIVAGAPLAAAFFGAPGVTPIIRGYGLVLFIGGFNNTGIIDFQKNLRFDRQALFNFGGNITNFLVVVVAALLLRNVWAFVLADIAHRIALLILSFRLHPYRPKWSWEPGRIRELFSFGRWVSASSAILFLSTQGDDIFVGKFLGTTMLGFYQMGFRISNTPTTEVSSVIGQVMFPTYARLQDNPLRLKEAYFKSLQIMIAPAFMLVAVLFALGRDIVWLMLGTKWLPMIPTMQILALAGTARAVTVTIGDLFYGVGKPRVQTTWEFVRLVVMAVLLYPLTKAFGLPGASGAVLASLLVPLVGFGLSLRPAIASARFEFLRYLFVPAASGAAMAGAAAALRLAVGGGWFGLGVNLAAGIAVFFGVHLLLERTLEYRIIDFIRDRVWPMALDLLRKARRGPGRPGGTPSA